MNVILSRSEGLFRILGKANSYRFRLRVASKAVGSDCPIRPFLFHSSAMARLRIGPKDRMRSRPRGSRDRDLRLDLAQRSG
jgi:hypothetical protein